MQDKNGAIIWRGPLKARMIKQFIADVEWRDLDYLIIDSPPGTGDEPLTVAQNNTRRQGIDSNHPPGGFISGC